MHYGPTITNPLLQVAVSSFESIVRHACDKPDDLDIHVEMEQSPEGKDTIHVYLASTAYFSDFTMLLRKYFDPHVLWRVTRHSWQHRKPATQNPSLIPLMATPSLN